MIVVKLELWPGGDESRKEDLGTALIANVSNLADLSSYSVVLKKGARYSNNSGETWRTGTVESFPRNDSRWGPWELLALALEVVVGKRIWSLRQFLAGHATGPVELVHVEKGK